MAITRSAIARGYHSQGRAAIAMVRESRKMPFISTPNPITNRKLNSRAVRTSAPTD